MAQMTAVSDLVPIALAIAGAVGAASLSVISKIIFDVYGKWSQHRADRRSLAAALAGEIGGYLANLDPETAAPNYLRLAALDRETRVRKLAAFPPLPTGHPVYDKVADKVGLLPPHLTREISRVYNAVTSMRLLITHFHAVEFLNADEDYQRKLIEKVAVMMNTYAPPAREAVSQLEKIALLSPFTSLQKLSKLKSL